MFNGFCGFGSWGSLGEFSTWGWTGLIFNLIFWLVLIAVLALLVFWVVRRARVSTSTNQYANVRPASKELLQAQYAKGEITREKYELMKQDIG